MKVRQILVMLLAMLVFAQVGQAQMVVAHRGASFDAPENTLTAFREAWIQQADAIEADFYVTSDQQIVCIHDKDTLRTGGEKLSVAGSTLAQLRELEYGAWKDKQFAGEPLPTFADVLACVPMGKSLVIELKTGPEIVPLLKQQLEAAQADPRHLLIIAFDAETVARCKELMPTIRAHWLTSYQKDKPSGQFRPSADEVAKTLKACSADGLGTRGDRQVVTADFIEQLKQQGLKEFHVWTVDAPEDAQYFQRLGAMGITTNRPALIRKAL